MTSSEASSSFRLACVPGVTPTKWVRIWNERLPDIPLIHHGVPAAEACDLLRDGGADAGLVRLPVDRTFFSAIPLYTEQTVVIVPKDHLVTAAEEVTTEDLADEILWHPLDEVLAWEDGQQRPGIPANERPATTGEAVELVAAGVGLLVVPQSLARLHHRRDLTYRPVSDAPVSSVALAWPEERTTDLVEDFIGIVRGRTVNSTRGRRPEPEPKQGSKQAPKSASKSESKPAASKRGQAGAGGARRGSAPGRSAGGKPRGGAGAPRGGRRGRPRRRS